MEQTDAGNAESLDILADLSSMSRRPSGIPCRIAVMRRDRPDLIPQWQRIVHDRPHRVTFDDIAEWFTNHDFPMTRNVPERHSKRPCAWCDQDLSA